MAIFASSQDGYVCAYALNSHDIVRLSDGSIAYVLSQDYKRRITWINTSQKVLCVSHSDLLERLVNIESALAGLFLEHSAQPDVLLVNVLQRVFLPGKDHRG